MYGNSLSNIASTGTVILKVDIIVKLQSIKLYNIVYIPKFHFNLISALKLEQLKYYINSINKHLINQKGYIIAFFYLFNNIYFIENPILYNSATATIKLMK